MLVGPTTSTDPSVLFSIWLMSSTYLLNDGINKNVKRSKTSKIIISKEDSCKINSARGNKGDSNQPSKIEEHIKGLGNQISSRFLFVFSSAGHYPRKGTLVSSTVI